MDDDELWSLVGDLIEYGDTWNGAIIASIEESIGKARPDALHQLVALGIARSNWEFRGGSWDDVKQAAIVLKDHLWPPAK